jgi:hypothetical protein
VRRPGDRVPALGRGALTSGSKVPPVRRVCSCR